MSVFTPTKSAEWVTGRIADDAWCLRLKLRIHNEGLLASLPTVCCWSKFASSCAVAVHCFTSIVSPADHISIPHLEDLELSESLKTGSIKTHANDIEKHIH